MKTKIRNGRVVEMSAEEEAAWEAQQIVDKAEDDASKARAAQTVADKNNAKAKLEALGLTSDEVSALTP